MEPNSKRVFCGNLPSDVTEHSLSKRFKKYGTVHSVEIKKRPDGSTFAYLDFESQNDIQSCLKQISQKQYKGHEIKVELAKESFLSRLAKERNSDKPTLVQNNKSNNEINGLNLRTVEIRSPVKKNKYEDIKSDQSMSDGELQCNNGLPMFTGINRALMERESCEKITCRMPDVNASKTMKTNSYSDFKGNAKDSHKLTENITKRRSGLNQNDSKHNESEVKRIKSVEEKRATHSKQLKTIKMALSSVDAPTNKKIFFDDMDESEVTVGNENQQDAEQNIISSNTALFDDDEMDVPDEENYFKIKSQFEGKKGQKLLELQSRYASDKRFTLDERFYESDENSNPETETVDDEKQRQIKILESVLGSRVHLSREKTNSWKMIRYDPTNPDHKKLELKVPLKVKDKGHKLPDPKEILDIPDKESKNQGINVDPEVLQEKYYKVSDTLKEALKNKGEKNEFSLLKLFDSEEGTRQVEDEDYKSMSIKKNNQSDWSSNPFKYDSSESEDEEIQEKYVAKVVTDETPLESKTETFFFQPNDIRLQEGLKFFTTMETIPENSFTEKRRELKKIVKTKVKKNLNKKGPWKRKMKGKSFKIKNNQKFL